MIKNSMHLIFAFLFTTTYNTITERYIADTEVKFELYFGKNFHCITTLFPSRVFLLLINVCFYQTLRKRVIVKMKWNVISSSCILLILIASLSSEHFYFSINTKTRRTYIHQVLNYNWLPIPVNSKHLFLFCIWICETKNHLCTLVYFMKKSIAVCFKAYSAFHHINERT